MAGVENVLLVGHSYLAEENRKQLGALGEYARVTVLSPRNWHEGMSEYDFDVGTIHGRNWSIELMEPRRFPGLPQSQYILPGLVDAVRRVGPDLINVESDPWTTFAVQSIRARNRLDRETPIVCTAKQNTYTRRGLVADWAKRRVAHWGVRNTARFIAVSDSVPGIYESRFGVPRGRFDLNTHLGLDTSLFRPVDVLGRSATRAQWLPGVRSEEMLCIGYCGRLERYKGLHELIDAVRQVRKTAARDVRLLLLGSGPMRVEIEPLSKAERWLHLFEKVPHARVASFLQALDLFVMPALKDPGHEEHDAHAVMEAMACGLPCVGTDSGAIPGVLGGTGTVVPAGDALVLADAITRDLKAATGTDFVQRGTTGRKRVEGVYSLGAVAKRNIATYNTALLYWRKELAGGKYRARG